MLFGLSLNPHTDFRINEIQVLEILNLSIYELTTTTNRQPPNDRFFEDVFYSRSKSAGRSKEDLRKVDQRGSSPH